MKIKLPNALRQAVQAANSELEPKLAFSQIQIAKLPADFLAKPAAVLGDVADFYLAAIERAFADATDEFYRDWPAALEIGRQTPAWRAASFPRIAARKKATEPVTPGALQFFIDQFNKALAGQVNLNDSLPPK
jgi:hypothetical protein